jgi:hypothetical protein
LWRVPSEISQGIAMCDGGKVRRFSLLYVVNHSCCWQGVGCARTIYSWTSIAVIIDLLCWCTACHRWGKWPPPREWDLQPGQEWHRMVFPKQSNTKSYDTKGPYVNTRSHARPIVQNIWGQVILVPMIPCISLTLTLPWCENTKVNYFLGIIFGRIYNILSEAAQKTRESVSR